MSRDIVFKESPEGSVCLALSRNRTRGIRYGCSSRIHRAANGTLPTEGLRQRSYLLNEAKFGTKLRRHSEEEQVTPEPESMKQKEYWITAFAIMTTGESADLFNQVLKRGY